MSLIKAPAVVPEDSGTVIASAKGGGRRWTANWTMAPAERDRSKAVRFTERGQGKISPFQEQVQWSLEAVWSAENSLQPLDSEKIVTTPAGAHLATERKHFDRSKYTVRFERQSANGRAEMKSLSIPPDSLVVEGIAGVLRFLPFDEGMPFPAHLLTNEPRLYSVTFEIQGKERVKTTAGEFEAYKVELVPHVGILNLLRAFVPKTFFWFMVSPPHLWVRYAGPENGPGTPEIVMERGK